MRAVLNISIPLQEKKRVERRAKKAKKTVSAYVLFALKLEENLISEDELVRMAKQAERDYKAGRTYELKSLEDLL